MANYAYTENNIVQELYDVLPRSWRNVSNFYTLEADQDYLKSLGWYRVVSRAPEYNPDTHYTKGYTHFVEGDVVIETPQIFELPPQQTFTPSISNEQQILEIKWNEVRSLRDKLMRDFDWRYNRYQRETRLGLPTTDNINDLDNYMQALADITKSADPEFIEWPVWSPTE